MSNYKIVDTHAHLCDPVFDSDRTEVIERARRAGVSAIFTVGENLSDAKLNIELAKKYPDLMPAAGLYPSYLDRRQADALKAFIRREKSDLIAIGEVGLDFWIVKEEPQKDIQRKIFSDFIELSIELGLPLNVHSRSAGRHAVAMLLAQGAKKVQLHAFDGKASTALPAIEAGYFFSIPPSIVRSRQKQKLVKILPLDCLLVESDSPVLGPSPEKRNEPSNVLIVVDAIAEIKNISREEVIEAVFENTCRLYGKFNLVDCSKFSQEAMKYEEKHY
jgi:TatD DNase family protein